MKKLCINTNLIYDERAWQMSLKARSLWITLLCSSDVYGFVGACRPFLAKFSGFPLSEFEGAINELCQPVKKDEIQYYENPIVIPETEVEGAFWFVFDIEKYIVDYGSERTARLNRERQEKYRKIKKGDVKS